ncbi:MAG: hypothetical protein KME17_29545 [Cyanosarcina radialis HA8281-LM2]|nr:hypothetical protein [Cyanosarcina radialis HA8281-LM2]
MTNRLIRSDRFAIDFKAIDLSHSYQAIALHLQPWHLPEQLNILGYRN